MISDSLSIANCFNIFFSKVGLKLAGNITYNGTKSVSSYLKHHVTSCFHFECVTPATVNKYISELAAKNSCGPDNISSILLKRLATHVVSPLTVMINQSLCTGIFPEKLKVVKVIHCIRKVTTISLTIIAQYPSSRLSQRFSRKLFLLKYITIFALINYSMKANTVSENVIQLNLQQLNLWIVFLTILMPVKFLSQFS